MPVVITPAAIIYSLIRIKKWIESDLSEPYGRIWKCKKDGLFVMFLVLTTLLHVVGLSCFLVGNNDFSDDSAFDHLIIWNSLMILLILIQSLITGFILFFLAKMSRAVWSRKLPLEESNRSTSFMDREVAAGWFDDTLLDLDYKFVPYLHNVPDKESDQRSSRHNSASTTMLDRLQSEDLTDEMAISN